MGDAQAEQPQIRYEKESTFDGLQNVRTTGIGIWLCSFFRCASIPALATSPIKAKGFMAVLRPSKVCGKYSIIPESENTSPVKLI